MPQKDEIKITKIFYYKVLMKKASLDSFTIPQIAKIIRYFGSFSSIAIDKSPEECCYSLVFNTDMYSVAEMKSLVRNVNAKIEQLLRLKEDLELVGMVVE